MKKLSCEREKEIGSDLNKLFGRTLKDPRYVAWFKQTFAALHLCEDDVEQAVLTYTLGKGVGNNFYSTLEAVATLHIHGYAVGSYHQTREMLVSGFLKLGGSKRILEVGFGYPSLHIIKLIEDPEVKSVTLYDYVESSLQYTREALHALEGRCPNKVTFGLYNMDDMSHPGSFDTYVFLDSIEHTKDPTEYLKLLVEGAPEDARFIFSIPICSLTPEFLDHLHYAEWKTLEDSTRWLNECGLEVVYDTRVEAVRGIDFFAELSPEGTFVNHVSLCRKKRYVSHIKDPAKHFTQTTA